MYGGWTDKLDGAEIVPFISLLDSKLQGEALAPNAPVGTPGLLLLERFDDPTSDRLPQGSADPALSTRTIVDGEYVLRKLDTTTPGRPIAVLRGQYANTVLGIDVRLSAETAQRGITVSCRTESGRRNGYRLIVYPATGRFALLRYDQDNVTPLADWQLSAAIQPGAFTNHVELSCSGTTISAAINGVEVASLQDSTYSEGSLIIGTTYFGPTPLTIEARFDNLVLLER